MWVITRDCHNLTHKDNTGYGYTCESLGHAHHDMMVVHMCPPQWPGATDGGTVLSSTLLGRSSMDASVPRVVL